MLLQHLDANNLSYESLDTIETPRTVLYTDNIKLEQWARTVPSIHFEESNGAQVLDGYLGQLEVWNIDDLQSYTQRSHELLLIEHGSSHMELGTVLRMLELKADTFFELCRQYNQLSFNAHTHHNSSTINLLSATYVQEEFHPVHMVFDKETVDHPFIKAFYLFLPDNWIGLIDTGVIKKETLCGIHLSLYGTHTTKA